jgi:hypothetical protein
MPLTLAEFHIRKRLRRRSLILLFDAACLLGWTTVQRIADLAGVPYDRARVELGELVRRGWLTREQRGPRNPRWREVCYASPVVTLHRSPVIGETGSHRSPVIGETLEGRARASDPDLSDPRSQDLIRPSVLGGAGGDGRTDGGDQEPRADFRNSFLAWVEARHAVKPILARPGLDRLSKHGATEHELRAFLTDLERGSHPCFDGIDHAQFRFGAACTVDRFEAWRKSRRPPLRRGPSVREQLDAPLEPNALSQAEAMAKLVRQQLSGHRKRGK